MTTHHTLELPDAAIAYDVHEPDTPSAHPPLLLVAQPMTAAGFSALQPEFTDRTVVTYDPRGQGRSTRRDGLVAHDPEQQARDLHALIGELGRGPVDMFASSGGAVTALALVAAFPDDLRALVAHEPPANTVLPDAELVQRASADMVRAYREHGFGAGMARFIRLVSHRGELTEAYFDQPDPDPAEFGLPTEDDGTRDDPIMGGASDTLTAFVPDFEAIRAASTKVVLGAGEQSRDVMTGRVAEIIAEQLDAPLAIFRGGHGGFLADEWGQPGDPALFADQVCAAID